MLGTKFCTSEPALSHAYGDTEDEMYFIHSDSSEIKDTLELTFEDWRLPPSIEDEEAMPGGRLPIKNFEEARWTRGQALYTFPFGDLINPYAS
jgi:hypothetical protein